MVGRSFLISMFFFFFSSVFRFFLFLRLLTSRLVVSRADVALHMAELQIATANSRADMERAEKEKEKALHRESLLRIQLSRNVHTTTRLIENPADTVSDWFASAPVVDFWLANASEEQAWGVTEDWKKYNVRDANVGETAHIQPMFSKGGILFDNFPSTSAWKLEDTHATCFLGLTHDVALSLKQYAGSAMSIGAVIELTGQAEAVKDYPSPEHKAKFIRDLLRVRSKCGGGGRIVHGCITDLSRILAVKLCGVEDGVPLLQKTSVLTGAKVCEMLTAFAFALPEALGVKIKAYTVQLEGADRAVSAVPSQQLGAGAQGEVFEIMPSTDLPDCFFKVVNIAESFTREVSALRALNKAGVQYVPQLRAVGTAERCFAAWPVGRAIDRGLTEVLELGAQLCDCLQQAHTAKLVHRDVRPSNMVLQTRNGRQESVLLDWACAVQVSQPVAYEGTTHFASAAILTKLASGERIVTVAPSDDLESLVYSIHWLTRVSELHAPMDCGPREYAAIKVAWAVAEKSHACLRDRLVLARDCKYEELKRSFLNY